MCECIHNMYLHTMLLMHGNYCGSYSLHDIFGLVDVTKKF